MLSEKEEVESTEKIEENISEELLEKIKDLEGRLSKYEYALADKENNFKIILKSFEKEKSFEIRKILKEVLFLFEDVDFILGKEIYEKIENKVRLFLEGRSIKKIPVEDLIKLNAFHVEDFKETKDPSLDGKISTVYRNGYMIREEIIPAQVEMYKYSEIETEMEAGSK
jgi:molecular chaperone GrpE (heat shock protein)